MWIGPRCIADALWVKAQWYIEGWIRDLAVSRPATADSKASCKAQSEWSGKVGAAPGDPIELERSAGSAME